MLAENSTTPRQLKPARILYTPELKALMERSNRQGMLHLSGHLTIMGASGYLWATFLGDNWFVAIPALVVYGFSLASMFAPVHECVHRTAFKSDRLNNAIAWFAGLLSLYNSTFFRYYHRWHHRYAQIPGKDPELDDPKPQTIAEYCWQMSGIPWWIGKIRGYYKLGTGKFSDYPFLPERVHGEVLGSIRLQLGVYGLGILVSLAFTQPGFLLYWLLPLAVGQPILRCILIAEHTHCTNDDNPLTNTRTTLTWFPIRFMMWNMPFHAEHHLYPSIPFHALPDAHKQLRSHFIHVEPGYVKVNRDIASSLS